jgi:beta-galactosidase
VYQGPYMVAEFYPGWLDHWGEPFQKVATDKIVKQTETYLKNNVNFNFYMVHGGTNFGFTSGANYNSEHDIQPDITSYDYDAPISESGMATEKYIAIRELMKKHVDYEVPEIPEPIPVITIPDIQFTKRANFFQWKNNINPIISDTLLSFEELGRGHGYVLYSKIFSEAMKDTLRMAGLRDYALVYVDGKKIGELNRIHKKYNMFIDIPAGSQLDVLVENMGRINYGAEIVRNTKGIISPIFIGNRDVTGYWKMYRIPMRKAPPVLKKNNEVEPRLPALYYAEFDLDKVGDTFLDMRTWGKGTVFVNGRNIGRYWNVGPQQTLYLPGCWLKKEKNVVVIFEQQNDNPQTHLKTIDRPILDSL